MKWLLAHRRWNVALVLPLLAATLACNAFGLPATKTKAVLTEAAAQDATMAAVEAQVGIELTQTALAKSARSNTPTPAELAVSRLTPTLAATGTPTAASTATPAPPATDTPTPAPGGAVVLDPCSLITTAEAKSLTGVDIGKPKAQNGGCLFADAATGRTSGVIVYALPASQSQFFFDQYVTLLKGRGVQVDPAAKTKLNADIAAGDMVAAVNDLTGMAAGQAKYNARKLDGVGDAALWSWNTAGQFQQGALIAAKPDAVAALILVTGASAKEADAQPPMQQTASRILGGLPASFTVAGLQVAGSGPVLDPCSLASPSNAEKLLGTKAGEGFASQGSCEFTDVATQKWSVRVFALPGGVAAANMLKNDAELMLAFSPPAKAKVLADVDAGDLVAAVRDMAPASQSGGPLTLESVGGLGDAAVFFALNSGSTRICIMRTATAKPGVLAGLSMTLGPGDTAATKSAAVALLTRVLAQLPPNFTVQ